MNKHRFFSSISFVRINYKTISLKTWSWIKNPLKKWKPEGRKLVFSKRCASKIWEGGGQLGHLKNSTPSPWNCQKTTSSAVFCATGVWGLTLLSLETFFKKIFWWLTLCNDFVRVGPWVGSFWILSSVNGFNGITGIFSGAISSAQSASRKKISY